MYVTLRASVTLRYIHGHRHRSAIKMPKTFSINEKAGGEQR